MKLKSKQSGATLLEVVITVLVLATGLLAMGALQTRSLQFNQSAFMRSQANIFAYDIIDRIRLNRGSKSANVTAYNVDYDASAPSTNTRARDDITAWRAAMAKVLPDAKGKIECANAAATATTRVCTVSIKWSDASLFGEHGESNPDGQTELIYTSSL
jgi:type IV pilus assembly protein PilV